MARRVRISRRATFLGCWVAVVCVVGMAARQAVHVAPPQGAGQPHGAREGATLQHGPLQREGSAAQKKHVQMEPRAQKPAAGRLPRKIDAPPNIPAVWDVFEELTQYEAKMVQHPEMREEVVRAAQHRTTAAELGITASDDLKDLESLPTRVAFLNSLADQVAAANVTRLAVVTTWGGSISGVRRDVVPWMQLMTELGVTHFYVLYDGTDSETVAQLSSIKHVTLLFLAPPFASAGDIEQFAAWQGRHWQWGGKPGNFNLMVKQGFGMQQGLRLAKQHQQDWLMHIDPDEVVYTMAESFSLATLLQRQPDHVSSVRFLNFEGQAEAGDLVNRFEQVTLFRTHQHYATPEAYRHRLKFRLGDNRSFLVLYANGKSAVRVVPGVRQLGPHYFSGNPSPRWRTEGNPHGQWQTIVSEDAVVLHYAYSYLSDVADKAAKSCPGEEYLAAARRGDRKKVKECFVIDIDQDAFMTAAFGDQAANSDFFFSRLVLSEGSRVRCRRKWGQDAWCILRDVEHAKTMLMRVNLLKRIHEPSVMLKQHERAIRMLLSANASTTRDSAG